MELAKFRTGGISFQTDRATHAKGLRPKGGSTRILGLSRYVGRAVQAEQRWGNMTLGGATGIDAVRVQWIEGRGSDVPDTIGDVTVPPSAKDS